MTRTAHDARFHPQPGDKSFRTSPPAAPYATRSMEVVSVGVGKPPLLTVDTTCVDGSVRRDHLEVDVWADDYDGAWTYVPAERDPRTDPQVGDTKTWISAHQPDYCIRQATVLERDLHALKVRVTRFDGVVTEERRTVYDWSDGRAWSWAVGTPAPAAPAAPPRAWWASRGLPECLAALPVPDDAALGRLDFVRAILAAGGVFESVDSEGTVALGGLERGTTLWREGGEVHYRVVRGYRTVTGHVPTVPGALSGAYSARCWLRAQTP